MSKTENEEPPGGRQCRGLLVPASAGCSGKNLRKQELGPGPRGLGRRRLFFLPGPPEALDFVSVVRAILEAFYDFKKSFNAVENRLRAWDMPVANEMRA